MSKLCELCGCEAAYNFHHFIPRTNHSNKWFKKNFTREELRQGADVCRQCHHMIHDCCPSEKELGRRYNSREKLLEHPTFSRYLRWKRKKLLGEEL